MTRRCSTCAINYPNAFKHAKCYACGANTDVRMDDKPHENWKQLAHDAHYTRREAEREGPSPEEIGRQEARTIIELEKQFR